MKLKQYRLSSNLTLFLKIFLPTFWIVFFGMIVLGMFILDPEDNPFLGNPIVKSSLLVGYLLFLLIFYKTIMTLKRVDADREYLYVSNYFKTYRYQLSDIQTIEEIDFGVVLILKVILKNQGAFGDKIPFILNRPTFDDYIENHPESSVYFQSSGSAI